MVFRRGERNEASENEGRNDDDSCEQLEGLGPRPDPETREERREKRETRGRVQENVPPREKAGWLW